MAIKKRLAASFVVLVIVSAMSIIILRRARDNLDYRWGTQFDAGDEMGAHQTALIFQRYDIFDYGLVGHIGYYQAVHDYMKKSNGWKEEMQAALDVLNRASYPDSRRGDNVNLLLMKSSMNAFLGHADLAKDELHKAWVLNGRGEPTLHDYISENLRFLSNTRSRLSAVDIFADASTGETINELDLATARFYKMMAFIPVDMSQAIAIKNDLVKDGLLNEELFHRICRDGQYSTTICKQGAR